MDTTLYDVMNFFSKSSKPELFRLSENVDKEIAVIDILNTNGDIKCSMTFVNNELKYVTHDS